MNDDANHLRTMIRSFDTMRLFAMTGGKEISRALWEACRLIEDLQARVTELEALVMDADRLPDIVGNLAKDTATDDGMPLNASPAEGGQTS